METNTKTGNVRLMQSIDALLNLVIPKEPHLRYSIAALSIQIFREHSAANQRN
jgi:hypothetical protein